MKMGRTIHTGLDYLRQPDLLLANLMQVQEEVC